MKHFIIVKLDDSIDIHKAETPVRELFHKALDIEGVDKVEVSVSNTDLPNRHDLMIEMLLTPTALKMFDHSEIHKKWKSDYSKHIVQKTIFDCDEQGSK